MTNKLAAIVAGIGLMCVYVAAAIDIPYKAPKQDKTIKHMTLPEEICAVAFGDTVVIGVEHELEYMEFYKGQKLRSNEYLVIIYPDSCVTLHLHEGHIGMPTDTFNKYYKH